jgi:hypothetical protein
MTARLGSALALAALVALLPVRPAAAAADGGYRMVDAAARVTAFGDERFLGIAT